MIREFYLSPRGDRGLSCDVDGAFVGAVPLLHRSRGEDEWQPRDSSTLSEEMGVCYGLPIDMAPKAGGLRAIAKAINEGDIARAQIAAVLLGIPDPPPLSKDAASRQRMIALIRDLHWSGMLKWDPDEHPRWPAGSTDGKGGEFAPKDEGGETDDVADRNPRIQLADAGMSDASDDPVAEGAARAAQGAPKLILAAAESDDERDLGFGTGGSQSPEELIPERLQQSPAGPVVEFLDNLLDITGPGDEANLEVATLQMRAFLHAIHQVDPNYIYESLEPPGGLAGMSWDERIGVINGLRADLAAAIYKMRGNIKPLQEVTLEFMQQTTNDAYDNAMKSHEAGSLKALPTLGMAVGNSVDRAVRARLEIFFNSLNISTNPDSVVRVNRRAYTYSGSYRLPDARVGNLVFDVSLEAKKPSKDQIRGFFRANFQPSGVIIIRPNQLGNNSSYIIWRPKGD